MQIGRWLIPTSCYLTSADRFIDCEISEAGMCAAHLGDGGRSRTQGFGIQRRRRDISFGGPAPLLQLRRARHAGLSSSPPPHPGSPYVHFPIVHAACCPIPNKVKIDPCLHVLLASHRTRHRRLAHRWIQRCFYCLFLPLPRTQIWCLGFIFTGWSTTYMILFLCSGIRITWSLFFRSIGVSLDTAAILMTRVSLDTFSI